MLRSRRVGLELLLAVILVASACQSTGTTATRPAELHTHTVPVDGGGSYADVSTGGLYVMLAEKDFLLINVHVPSEGEIEGTDPFIPYNEIEQNLHQLPTDLNAKLVLYCRSGGRGAIAARTLVRQGYSNVWNPDGGMISWTKAGYPLLGA
jgi:phage shock protein E